MGSISANTELDGYVGIDDTEAIDPVWHRARDSIDENRMKHVLVIWSSVWLVTYNMQCPSYGRNTCMFSLHASSLGPLPSRRVHGPSWHPLTVCSIPRPWAAGLYRRLTKAKRDKITKRLKRKQFDIVKQYIDDNGRRRVILVYDYDPLAAMTLQLKICATWLKHDTP